MNLGLLNSKATLAVKVPFRMTSLPKQHPSNSNNEDVGTLLRPSLLKEVMYPEPSEVHISVVQETCGITHGVNIVRAFRNGFLDRLEIYNNFII